MSYWQNIKFLDNFDGYHLPPGDILHFADPVKNYDGSLNQEDHGSTFLAQVRLYTVRLSPKNCFLLLLRRVPDEGRNLPFL